MLNLHVREVKLVPAEIAVWAVNQATRLLAGYAILQGLNIIFTPPTRWISPALQIALQVPGAPPSWGAVILTAGVLMMVGNLAARFTPIIIGAWLAAIWSMFFALTLLGAVLKNSGASTMGLYSYGLVAALYVGVAVLHRQSRKIHYAAAHQQVQVD